MRYGGVYEVLDTVSGKRYVGSSQNVKQRLAYHRNTLRRGVSHNVMLQRAFSARPEAFRFNVLAILEPNEVLPTEQRLLDIEHKTPRMTFNVAKSAMACMTGLKHTEEWKSAQREWTKGNKSRSGMHGPWSKENPPPQLAKLIEKSKQPSIETRQKMSAAKVGKEPPNKGKHKTHCSNGHPLIGDNLRVYIRGHGSVKHICKQCSRDRSVKYLNKSRR